jgi:serine/threonine protein kinase
MQVIHSDLKVRNVLLKSDGSSERGCVAKVADFGLAVKMDTQDTHVSAFQVRPLGSVVVCCCGTELQPLLCMHTQAYQGSLFRHEHWST